MWVLLVRNLPGLHSDKVARVSVAGVHSAYYMNWLYCNSRIPTTGISVSRIFLSYGGHRKLALTAIHKHTHYQTIHRTITILFTAGSRLALDGLDHRFPAHDARGPPELSLLRAGRAYHLQKKEVHDVPPFDNIFHMI
jgi:hypothetical protein